MKLAAIDIGTNTLRLIVGEVNRDGRISEYLLERRITRLGGGFDGYRLHPASRRRTLDALRDFSVILKKQGVTSVRAAATSVVRRAADGDDFIREIRKETGIDVEVITGKTEASITLKGVLSALDGADRNTLVFDIGGGSTEYIVAEGGSVRGLVSIEMGVVPLTERYLKSDPPSAEEIRKIEETVDAMIGKLKGGGLDGLEIIDPSRGSLLVGTAGTVTTLAALDMNLETYDRERVNNYVLTKEGVSLLFRRLAAMSHRERASIASVEEGRADLIIPGTIIVLRTMENFGFSELVVSDYGLLEGLLLDLAERKGIVS